MRLPHSNAEKQGAIGTTSVHMPERCTPRVVKTGYWSTYFKTLARQTNNMWNLGLTTLILKAVLVQIRTSKVSCWRAVLCIKQDGSEYCSNCYNSSKSSLPYCSLHRQGWTGLLLDGGNKNETINLHKEFICPDTIVGIFDKFKVPLEADYVRLVQLVTRAFSMSFWHRGPIKSVRCACTRSVDIDSYDLWVLRALLKSGYRPRVVTAGRDAT
jgi:hypothetical protein